MNIEIAWTQHCGNNPGQQDALWNGSAIFQERDLPAASAQVSSERWCFAVADGVAISPAPHLASRFTLAALAAELSGGEGRLVDTAIIRRIHGRLCDRLAKGRTFGASTTLVVAQCHAERCTVFNVGDSHAYRWAANGEWQRLSRDHTVLQGLIARGEAEAEVDYASLYDGLEYCLIADDEETDFPVHRAEAPFLPGDRLLLCSDGVHDVLGEARVIELADPSLSALAQVEVWRQAVLDVGAPDNFSLVLAKR